MDQVSATYRIPADPQPTKVELKAVLSFQTRIYLDEYLSQQIAMVLWRAARLRMDPNAFLVRRASDVRTLPDGHPSFESYLQGNRWSGIRRLVMQRAGGRCECCGPAYATDVRIRDYRRRVLLGQNLLPLVAICRPCLDNVQGDPVTGQPYKSYEEMEFALAQIFGRRSRKLDERRIAA